MLKDLFISRISICLEKRGSLQNYKSITGFLSLLYGIKKKSLFAQKIFFPFISTYLLNFNFLITNNSFILKIKEEDDEIESKL